MGSRSELVTPLSLALVVLGLALHALPPRGLQDLAARLRRWPAPLAGLAIGAAVMVVDVMRPEGIAPFIYYQF